MYQSIVIEVEKFKIQNSNSKLLIYFEKKLQIKNAYILQRKYRKYNFTIAQLLTNNSFVTIAYKGNTTFYNIHINCCTHTLKSLKNMNMNMK
jgi:hypothetical protein